MAEIEIVWRKSDELPKEGSDILLIHFDHVSRGVALANYSNGRFRIIGESKCNFVYPYKWSENAWKIKRWCYTDDMTKLGDLLKM